MHGCSLQEWASDFDLDSISALLTGERSPFHNFVLIFPLIELFNHFSVSLRQNPRSVNGELRKRNRSGRIKAVSN